MPLRDSPDLLRQYKREWAARRRAEWMQLHGPCIDCSSTESLQIDHINPHEKVAHSVWSWRADRRDAELAKCVVRCKPCHVRKTYEVDFPLQHGMAGYRRGCRCDECRQANNDKGKRLRMRKRQVIRINDQRSVPALFELVARAAHLPNEVRCVSCPVVYQVRPEVCLAYGWPEHCGQTMELGTTYQPLARYGGVHT